MNPQASRAFSVTWVVLPKWRRAAARAASGVMPLRRKLSVSISTWLRTSSARSPATPLRPVTQARTLLHHWRISLSLRTEHATHGFDESLPFGTFFHQLFPAQRGQPVIAGAARVGRHLPLRGQPLSLQQALQSGIERAVIDHEFVPRLLFQELADP